MSKKLILLILLLLLCGNIYPQKILPVSKENILVFIEPFDNQSPGKGQEWLTQGLPGFLRSTLADTEHLHTYIIPDLQSGLVDRPHRLQNIIWKSVFQKRVDPMYETYLILGSYSYLEDQITIRMDLLSLRNTQVLGHFEDTLPYTKLLSWKESLGDWILTQLRLVDSYDQLSTTRVPALAVENAPLPGVALSEQLTTLFDKKQRNETETLRQKYDQQSRLKLGNQLETLWHDIAYDPYLANIHDIHTLRLQYEPDSILVSFKVSYRINPRILDEIEHFSRTRSGLVGKTESFEEHAFMDLGYIDADFTKEIASGDWRIVPIISMGAASDQHRRVFYHSYPSPIQSPGAYYFNQGKFKQLLLAIPGVNALRIFAQELQQDYKYSIVIGYDEIKYLDKIQVKFVAEQSLAKEL
ncbi:MAG: hypothetical protein U9Q77_00955 [Candidatus Marinimicrobia bacterium]|nr:hypothetical protein [Candidatus Neomarinimicrobiota bacterium]